jgi:hypothetical protein
MQQERRMLFPSIECTVEGHADAEMVGTCSVEPAD